MIFGAAHQFAPLHPSLRSVCQVQTGGYNIGIDTFDSLNYLCHNDKSFESCCILGIQSDMISSREPLFHLGVLWIRDETIVLQCLRGSQLSFNFTIRF